jgi:peptidyl-prolyl cis-trans isomerase B (cyclophilin B)
VYTFILRRRILQPMNATFETSKGTINLNLFEDRAPVTVANFVNLVQQGYYNGLGFHRVIEDFMVQGGCPLGTGSGGPGYTFEDECTPELKHDKPGVLSMANAGPGTNGSQFFITHVPTPWLDGKHTVFGAVESPSDMETVNTIKKGDTINSISIEGDADTLLQGLSDRVQAWNASLGK